MGPEQGGGGGGGVGRGGGWVGGGGTGNGGGVGSAAVVDEHVTRRSLTAFLAGGPFSGHWSVQVQCRFTSTEAKSTINVLLLGTGEPRAATATFTQLLSSEIKLSKFTFALHPQ